VKEELGETSLVKVDGKPVLFSKHLSILQYLKALENNISR